MLQSVVFACLRRMRRLLGRCFASVHKARRKRSMAAARVDAAALMTIGWLHVVDRVRTAAYRLVALIATIAVISTRQRCVVRDAVLGTCHRLGGVAALLRCVIRRLHATRYTDRCRAKHRKVGWVVARGTALALLSVGLSMHPLHRTNLMGRARMLLVLLLRI